VFCDRATGEIIAADSSANAIAIFDEGGAPLFEFSDDEHLVGPYRVTVDAQGRIYVLDGERWRVKVFSYRGEFLKALELPGFTDPKKVSFTAIAIDGNGDLYLGESTSGQVLVFDKDLRLKLKLGSFGNDKGQFEGIGGIAMDAERIYVSSQRGVGVHVFSRHGTFLKAWGYHAAGTHNVSLPAGIAVDAKGRIILVDTLRQEIKYFDPEGRFIDGYAGYGHQPGAVSYPTAISIDRYGRLCVADAGNVRVQVFAPVEPTPAPEAPTPAAQAPEAATPAAQATEAPTPAVPPVEPTPAPAPAEATPPATPAADR
jgi:sugar lactone lactonase YvrE